MIAEVAGEVEVPTMPIEKEEMHSGTVGMGSFNKNYEMTIHTPRDIGGLINIRITTKTRINGIFTNIDVSSTNQTKSWTRIPGNCRLMSLIILGLQGFV